MATKYILAVGLLLGFLQICQCQHSGRPPRRPPTCQVPRPCPIAIVIHDTCCNFFSCWICNIQTIIVLQTCENTERCKPRFPSCHPGGIVEAGKLISPVNETLLEPGNAEEEETRGNTIRVQCDVPNTNVVCTVSIPDPCNQGAVEPANPPTVAVTGGQDGDGGNTELGGNTEVAFANGGWSEWNPWVSGNCPVTCCMGNPLQSRTRRCNNPAPAGGGADCQGLHYGLRDAPDTERCGSMDNQCPIICESATSKYADTCSRCVNNYYECEAEGAAPGRANCPAGQVWSQHMTGCVTPSFCNAVERF